MDYAVEAASLTKRFHPARGLPELLKGRPSKEVLAVDNVSFSVGQGEVLGLVGPNGAGKTTLINLLCTLHLPTAGTARVEGRDVVKDAAAVRRLIGLVTSNERSFYWRLTGRQNLRFFAELYRVPHREISPRIEALLDALDLRTYVDIRFDRYSTGIRQRLACARALLHRPRVLFMDEPTKGLDPTAAPALIRMIREQIMEIWGPTILITSHNLKEIEQLCDRVAIMSQGRILCCGNLDELRMTVQMVGTHRIRVGNLSPQAVEVVGALPGVFSVRAVENDGSRDLEVRLSGGEGVLSAVLRTALANGGEVYHCSEELVSLEEVFSRVVSSTGEG